jgi:hypothetical protein
MVVRSLAGRSSVFPVFSGAASFILDASSKLHGHWCGVVTLFSRLDETIMRANDGIADQVNR